MAFIELRAAAQQALEALELYVPKEDYENRPVGNVIDALRAALAEPTTEDSSAAELAQEPVAWRYQDARGNYRYRGYVQGFDKEYSLLKPVPLYTSPPQTAEPVQEPVQQALCEADRIMGHDDEATEWRERWAHLFSCALTNGGYQCSCGANQRNAK